MGSEVIGELFDKVLGRMLPSSERHLPDRALAALFCKELPLLHRWAAMHHLAKCPHCRSRKQTLEGPRANRMIELYCETISDEETRLHQGSRGEFAVWLDMQLLLDPPQRRPRSRRSLPHFHFPSGIPALSLGLALGLFVGVSGVYFWWLERVPHITSNTLLVRAEKWDTLAASSSSAVVYQAIQIKTSEGVVKRTLYRDLQAKRKSKVSPPYDETARLRQEQLRSELNQAGVDWEQPLSASSYQAWHDRQHERSDRIAFAGNHLLTLTTSVPQGVILRQTLTVRETDFHPVRRAVDFRDRGTVEIAELDFRVLPWSAVDTSVFEPVAEAPGSIAVAVPLNRPSLVFDALSTADQLDETELAARLVLNQLHADTGEQIEIRRTNHEVEVVGLVETEERKHELRTQLVGVPRLKVLIQSATDAKNVSNPETDQAQVQSASLPDSPSVIEIYLKARGHSVDEINATSSELLSRALTISHESKALAELGTRFASRQSKPLIVSATVTDLLYSHHERLEAALRQQQLLLARTDGQQSAGEWQGLHVSAADETSLTDRAALNLALTRELTQTNTPSPRSAEAIFAELKSTLNLLHAYAGELYAKSQRPSSMSGKD